MTTLGYGEFVPHGLPWVVLASAGALTATILLTVSLSYVLSVLSASIMRKQLAQDIFSLGKSVGEIVNAAGFGEEKESLNNHFIDISSAINYYALNHLAYPVLRFFHSSEPDRSPALAILLLSDAWFILDNLPEKNDLPEGFPC